MKECVRGLLACLTLDRPNPHPPGKSRRGGGGRMGSTRRLATGVESLAASSLGLRGDVVLVCRPVAGTGSLSLSSANLGTVVQSVDREGGEEEGDAACPFTP